MSRQKPNEPGIYWARSSPSLRWYDLIVEVGGEAPWLKICWIQPRIGKKIDYPFMRWGPKICDKAPEVPDKEIGI